MSDFLGEEQKSIVGDITLVEGEGGNRTRDPINQA